MNQRYSPKLVNLHNSLQDAVMDQKFDVVVAGCGVAGLSAAVTAAERGLKVAVLERASRDDRGGQSR